MKAIVKSIWSSDIVGELSNYEPDDPENFVVYLQIIVCPEDVDCGQFWQLTVCTPKWLETHFDKSEIVSGRHHLIVFEYNYRRLVERIRGYITNFCTGDTWDEISEKISKFALSEFEDYKP